jgi:hypothetical protein
VSNPSVLSFSEGTGDVIVDLPTLVATRAVITGDSRSGKSRMVRQLLEQTHGRIPHLIIDPEGDFPTLREKFDYLLVGRGGELAADVATAGTLAQRIFKLRASAIFDLSDMKPKPQQEYVATVLEALMEIHQHEGHPTLVIVDEAQRFAAEKTSGSRSHDALWDVSGRGGKRGFSLIAITPRISDLSKQVAGGLQNRLIFRTTLDNDVERSGKMLGFRTVEQRGELLRLGRGECFAYGPAIGTGQQVYRVRGVAETKTTHIDVTRGARPAPPPAPTAIKALVAELREFEAEAKEEKDRTEKIAAENAELRRRVEYFENLGAPAPAIDEDALQLARDEARYDEARRHERYRQVLVNSAEEAIGVCAESIVDLEGVLAGLRLTRDQLTNVIAGVGEEWVKPVPPDPAPRVMPVVPRATPTPLAPPAPRASATNNGNGSISGPGQRILDAIAFYESLGTATPSKKAIAAFCGVSPNTGSWANRLSELRTAGLIGDPDRERIALTATGRAAADRSTIPKSRRELHDRWLTKLSGPAAKILRILIDTYPDSIDKNALAAHVGVSASTGSWANRLSELRVPGLLDDVSRTEVRAAATLFPKGLR